MDWFLMIETSTIKELKERFDKSSYKTSLIIAPFIPFGNVNPSVPNAPLLYPPENIKNFIVFLCFQGVEKGYNGSKWVNVSAGEVLITTFLQEHHNKTQHLLFDS